jgi:hypothetical protein
MIWTSCVKRLNVWHKWFAWHPVVVCEKRTPTHDCYKWAWLTTVWRRCEWTYGDLDWYYQPFSDTPPDAPESPRTSYPEA